MLQRLRDSRRRGTRCAVAAVSLLGRRHAAEGVPNQDTHFACRVADAFVAAVFDGHGDAGETAALLVSKAVREALETSLDGAASVPLEAAVADAFVQAARAVGEHECAKESGTTATIVAVRGDSCVVGHVGDSAAVVLTRAAPLVQRLVPRFMTRPHRPGASAAEDARVMAAGGIVANGYVVDQVTRDKVISVTRTLGDADMVVNGCIAEPEIRSLRLEKRDIAIVIASDGLWDAGTSGVCAGAVAGAVSGTHRKAEMARDAILALVEKSGGNCDDCTIVVVSLRV